MEPINLLERPPGEFGEYHSRPTYNFSETLSGHFIFLFSKFFKLFFQKGLSLSKASTLAYNNLAYGGGHLVSLEHRSCF